VLETNSSDGVHESLTAPNPLPEATGMLEAELLAPLAGSLNVPVDTVVRLEFSEAPEGLDGIVLLGPDGEVPATAAAALPTAAVTLTPDAPLAPGTGYRVVVPAGLSSAGGAMVARSRVWAFATAATAGEPVVVPAPARADDDDAWSVGAWVDPLGDTAQVDFTPPGGAPAQGWAIDRATTLYTVAAPLETPRVHLLGVRVQAGSGAAAAFDLPFALGWADLTPAGLTAPLNGLALLSATEAVAVGDGGTLIATADGGLTWRSLDGGTGADLRAVHFVTPRSGWAVGAGGTLLHTTDGDTWLPKAAGTTDGLNDLTFVAGAVGVAVGDGGRVLFTRDGGDTWDLGDAPTTARLNRVACTVPGDCHAVGDGGVILRSRDGGATWTRQASGTGVDLLGIAYTGDGFRWIVGEGGIVLVEGDGMEGWVVRGATGQASLNAVTFADPFDAWAVGTGTFLIRTDDGGLTWRAQYPPAGVSLRAVAARGGRRVMAVGMNPAGGGPVILATDTGGAG
jgi:photosystem II stability/assembly factor-like uncharacterized protein